MLLCFSAYHTRDELLRILHCEEEEEDSRRSFGSLGREIYVDSWLNEESRRKVFVTTIRVRSPAEYLQDLSKLRGHFQNFIVYHESISQEELAALGNNFHLNPTFSVLEQEAGIQLSDNQRAQYTQFCQQPIQVRPSILNGEFHRTLLEEYRALQRQGGGIAVFGDDGSIQRIANSEEGNIRGMHEDEEDADDLERIFNPRNLDEELTRRALQLSQQQEEARQAAQDRTRLRLQEGWETILKRSEPKKRGYPVCICCTVSRATICLVECGCVVLCDDCVREIWTRSSLKKVCPNCQQECTMISRVRFSEMADASEEEEAEPSEKKKMKKEES